MEKLTSETSAAIFEQPNLLFGNDVYFSPTPYLDELRNKHSELTEQNVQKIKDLEWDENQYGSRATWEEHMQRSAENNAQSEYFVMRFRGRNLPDTIREDSLLFNARYYPADAEVSPDVTDAEFALLDRFLGEQAWATTFDSARRLYEILPVGSAEKERAKTYAAYSGGIIAQEFCSLAVAYADERLAQEYVPRLKHLITVCWPVIDALREFAPNEASVKMQLLREILLEHLAQVGDEYAIDSHIKIMGSDFSLSDEDVLTKFYVMDTDEPTKQRVSERMELHVQRLVAEHKYLAAINVLYKTALSTGLGIELVQERIDELALVGIDQLSRNYGHIDEYDIENIQHNRAVLIDNGHISKEMRQRLRAIYDSRNVEELHSKFLFSNDPNDAKDLLLAIAGTSREQTRTIGRATVYNLAMMAKKFIGSSLETDRMIEAYLCTSGIDDFKVYVADIIAVQMDTAITKIEQNPDNHLQPFLAVVSPVIRATRPSETPDDDDFWKLVSRKQVAEYFAMLRNRHGSDFIFRYGLPDTEGVEEVTLKEDEEFMMRDVRNWLKEVWDYLEYYED